MLPCMRCAAERVGQGSGRVLPALRHKLPLEKVKPTLRWAVMPGVIVGSVVLAFQASVTLWVMVPTWLVFAHRFGTTAHCPPREKRRARRKTAQDPEDGPERQQPEEEREADTAAHRER